MKKYYCEICRIYALAINFGNEIPNCRCGFPMIIMEEEE